MKGADWILADVAPEQMVQARPCFLPPPLLVLQKMTIFFFSFLMDKKRPCWLSSFTKIAPALWLAACSLLCQIGYDYEIYKRSYYDESSIMVLL